MNRRPSFLVTLVLAAAWCMAVPAVTSTQSPPARAASAADAVRHGEAWFYQRCSLCHMGRIVKDDVHKPMGPSLEGLLKGATPTRENQIREQIQKGSPRMPGFRYTFTPDEFEELIAYMKTL